jgi:hypothetical protein
LEAARAPGSGLMPSETASIYLADYLDALHLLDVRDEATRSAIACLLGLELLPVSSGKKKEPDEPPSPASPLVDSSPATPSEEESPIGRRPGRRSSAGIRHSFLERLPAEVTPWVVSVEPLPRGPSEEKLPPPPLEPLFAPQWTRGILSAALATLSSQGELDIERIVEALAQRHYLQRVPRRPLPTLRHGVQVLVDRSQAMIPFHRDQDWLVKEIQKVVGEGKTQALRFAGCPLSKAGAGPRKDWEDYRPPLPATPVLLLTDLGIGRPPLSSDWASVEDWLLFARILRTAGCPIVALVPYASTLPDGRARWPAELVGVMTILLWDRGTSATTVRNRLGPANQVPE